MAYELKQELKLTQSLVMTPQLQLAIKLLQLTRMELVEAVREEMQTNPVIEDAVETDVAAQSSPTPEEADSQRPDPDWQSYIEERSGYKGSSLDFSARDDDDDFMSNVSSLESGLTEHLLRQLRLSGLEGDKLLIGECIIGNISEDGYLRVIDHASLDHDRLEAASLAEIAGLTNSTEEAVMEVLTIILHFDPLGVGARSLRECLLTQVKELPVRDTVAENLIETCLGDLANRNFKSIAKKLDVSVEEVFEAVKVINKHLNPNPGSRFGSETSRAVTPDVYINKVGDDYIISLNEDGLPKLKISKYYREMIKSRDNADQEARRYVQDKLKSAVWLIKSIHQRQRTIYKVVERIIELQREFLDKGLKYLRPMVLKDVAESIGMHESTVSRVTSNKYVQTPRGLFELKYFFSSGMSSSDGEDVASEYIKEKVRDIIKNEDARKPLSDMRIVELLKEQGIVVARRTAAKYRETLGILSSSKRKAHF